MYRIMLADDEGIVIDSMKFSGALVSGGIFPDMTVDSFWDEFIKAAIDDDFDEYYEDEEDWDEDEYDY